MRHYVKGVGLGQPTFQLNQTSFKIKLPKYFSNNPACKLIAEKALPTISLHTDFIYKTEELPARGDDNYLYIEWNKYYYKEQIVNKAKSTAKDFHYDTAHFVQYSFKGFVREAKYPRDRYESKFGYELRNSEEPLPEGLVIKLATEARQQAYKVIQECKPPAKNSEPLTKSTKETIYDVLSAKPLEEMDFPF